MMIQIYLMNNKLKVNINNINKNTIIYTMNPIKTMLQPLAILARPNTAKER